MLDIGIMRLGSITIHDLPEVGLDHVELGVGIVDIPHRKQVVVGVEVHHLEGDQAILGAYAGHGCDCSLLNNRWSEDSGNKNRGSDDRDRGNGYRCLDYCAGASVRRSHHQ